MTIMDHHHPIAEAGSPGDAFNGRAVHKDSRSTETPTTSFLSSMGATMTRDHRGAPGRQGPVPESEKAPGMTARDGASAELPAGHISGPQPHPAGSGVASEEAHRNGFQRSGAMDRTAVDHQQETPAGSGLGPDVTGVPFQPLRGPGAIEPPPSVQTSEPPGDHLLRPTSFSDLSGPATRGAPHNTGGSASETGWVPPEDALEKGASPSPGRSPTGFSRGGSVVSTPEPGAQSQVAIAPKAGLQVPHPSSPAVHSASDAIASDLHDVRGGLGQSIPANGADQGALGSHTADPGDGRNAPTAIQGLSSSDTNGESSGSQPELSTGDMVSQKEGKAGFSERRLFSSQILDRMAERITVLSRGESTEMRIDLKPDFFGAIRLHISLEDQQLAIRIVTEVAMVKDLIEHQLNQLRADLQDRGVDVGSLDVRTQQETDHSGFGRHLKSANDNRQRRSSPQETDDPQAPGLPGQDRTGSTTLIDYFV